MQDEFEIFRAEAYGQIKRPQSAENEAKRKEMFRGTGSVPRFDAEWRGSPRRHSSVGINRMRPSLGRSSQKNTDGKESTFQSSLRSDTDADVMVEIQPPSPTEAGADGSPLKRVFEEWRPAGTVKPGLWRRKTAPAEQRRIHQEESWMKVSRTMTLAEEYPGGTPSKVKTSDSAVKGTRNCSRKQSVTETVSGHVPLPQGLTTRPRDLKVFLHQSNSISRRKSTACTPVKLLPLYQQPRKYRRNSYAGAQQTSRSLSPTGRSTGRVNSAIIYLSEGLSSNTISPGSGTIPRRRSYDGGGLMSNKRRASAASRLDHTGTVVSSGDLSGSQAVAACSSQVLNKGERRTEEDSNREPDIRCNVPDDLTPVYKIVVLGAQGVGKTTLTRQLLTSEYLANKEEQFQDQEEHELREHSVCIKLDDEESIVHLFDDSDKDAITDITDVDVYLVVYSVTSRSSFSFADVCVSRLRRLKPRHTVTLLVANKQDQVRNRVISPSEGKRLAAKRLCQFIEVSALLDHRVDEVLTKVIRDTRLQRKRLLELHTVDSEEAIPRKPCILLAFSLCGKLLHS